jgi:hypothetical protein
MRQPPFVVPAYETSRLRTEIQLPNVSRRMVRCKTFRLESLLRRAGVAASLMA